MNIPSSQHSAQPPGSLFERLYVIFFVIYLSSSFEGFSEGSGDAPVVGSAINTGELLLRMAMYLPAIVFVARHLHHLRTEIRACRWAFALAGLALVSAMWSDDQLFVIRKASWVFATTVVGIYFGSRFRREEFVALICYALGLISFLSLLAVVCVPQYGLDPAFQNSEWRGIFETKNMLGRAMVLGLTAVFSVDKQWLGGNLLRAMWLIGFATIVVMSKSVTAVIVAAALLLIRLMCRPVRLSVTAPVAIALGSLFTLTLITVVNVVTQDAFYGLFGREESLTGRMPLWDAVIDSIRMRPLVGYGFSSFWTGPNGPSAMVVNAVGWSAPHAHNGFLDLCLELGIVGLATFGIGFLIRLQSAIRECRAGFSASIWPLVYLSFTVFYNLTESTLRLDGVYWALYTASLIPDARYGTPGRPDIPSVNSDRATNALST